MSNIIKASNYASVNDIKLIDVIQKPIFSAPSKLENQLIEESEETQKLKEEINHVLLMKEQMIKDAETYAEEQIKAAMDEVSSLKQQAQLDIEQWWNERRLSDDQYILEAKQAGFDQGFQEGKSQAELSVREEYDGMLEEAKSIIEQAVLVKQQMIQESEPFLIELSCSIAEKIIGYQLTLSPDWVVDLVKKVLYRRREQGIITLCVAPAHFSFIQNARDELSLAIDSQADLQIIPDATVLDHGCVIRSSFGSIDARIDTQLNEIKKALRQIAERDEDSQDNE